MNTRFLFVLVALIAFCFKSEAKNSTINVSKNDTLLLVCVEKEYPNDSVLIQPTYSNDNSTGEDTTLTYSDGISTLTMIINEINNLLTAVEVFLALITVIIGLAGFFGFRGLTKFIEDFTKQFKEQDAKLETYTKEIDRLKKVNEKIEKKHSLNNQYLQSINQMMFNNVDAIAEANGANSEHGKYLKKNAMINFNLMKLYLSTDEKEIEQCTNYIKTQGEEEVINHLQFIVDNDPYNYKRNKASEAIGYIRARLVN